MAQLRDHDAIQAKRDFFMVDPRKLTVDPSYNVRDLDSLEARPALDELKGMVRSDGVRTPLVVRLSGDDLVIVQGHRRHRVAMELISEGYEIKAVPAIAEQKGVNEADRTFDLLVSNSGEPLAPLEIAEVIRRLVNFGWTEAQIAQRRGWRSTQTVTNYLSLLEMPEAVKEHVKQGHVSATLAREMVNDTNGHEAAATISAGLEKHKVNGKRARVTRRTIERAPAPKVADFLSAIAPIVEIAEAAEADCEGADVCLPSAPLRALAALYHAAKGE